MTAKEKLMTELEIHMDSLPGGRTGELLRNCYKMIRSQGYQIQELKKKGKQ